jgi:leucyl aminopeptidase
MKIEVRTNGSPQILIIPIEQNDNLEDRLMRAGERAGVEADIIQNDFKAAAKESMLIYSASSTRVYLLGLGKNPKFQDYRNIFRSFFNKNKPKLTQTVGIDVSQIPVEMIEAVANGIELGSYEIGNLHKTDVKNEPNFYTSKVKCEFYTSHENLETVQNLTHIGLQTADTQRFILNVVNQPSNFKNPSQLGKMTIESGLKHGFEVTVMNEEQCRAMGFDALLSVGKGSENQPVMIQMEYKPANPVKKIGLVGKGITFDTGGISIKPSNGMSYMKSDMGGAAAVLGTMELVAKLKLPIHLIGIIPSAENTVDGNAIKPGFVIGSYAKKTIEVIDTDAEGRLVLADGLNYMKKQFEPEIMIDLATLTGNVIAALGYNTAGLFSKNQELANQLLEAGQKSGEKLWQMPMFDEYGDMMKSDVADIKNLSSAPVAGAATAAKFLEFFTDEHTAWAHLDIAGTAFGDSEYASMKSATAWGIQLLTSWMRNLVK